MSQTTLRIGDLASAAGTTTRTVRYYEEIGLLPERAPRPAGGHRLYCEADLERLREIVRLRDLLGVPLERLKALVEAEDARAALRAEYHQTQDEDRRREILREGLGHLDRQLELVRARTTELRELEEELVARRRRVRARMRS